MPIKKDTKEEIQELVYNWINWLFTRSFYGTPLPEELPKNIKEHYISTGEPPNARNDPLCSAFNLIMNDAIQNDTSNLVFFLYVYAKNYRIVPIKTYAFDINLATDTVYQRADKLAMRYYRRAQELERMSDMIQREVMADIYD